MTEGQSDADSDMAIPQPMHPDRFGGRTRRRRRRCDQTVRNRSPERGNARGTYHVARPRQRPLRCNRLKQTPHRVNRMIDGNGADRQRIYTVTANRNMQACAR